MNTLFDTEPNASFDQTTYVVSQSQNQSDSPSWDFSEIYPPKACEDTSRLIANDWFRNASFEMAAGEAKKLGELSRKIPPGSLISVVHLPDKKIGENMEFLSQIKERGFEPVPHLAARNLSDKGELRDILKNFQNLEIREVLLIGGGLNEVKGNFITVMDMLETGLFEEYGIERFAVAGHPEKHPFASEEEIMEGYRRKYEYFTQKNLEFYMITQFTFNPDSLLDLAANLWENGLRFPIRAGVVGKCGFPNLLKYSLLCGIGNSIKVLKKEMSNIKNLAKGYLPETFVNPLVSKISTARARGEKQYDLIEGLHLFPFGNLGKTLDHFEALTNQT